MNIRSRIASTVQSASIPDNNLTKDQQQALKRLKNDNNIVILPADKRVTVVMDKTDYFDKMDALVNDKQTYEELKRDPTPALQRKLNSKLLTLNKTDSTTETLRTTETTQTWYTYATHSVILWIPYVSTI